MWAAAVALAVVCGTVTGAVYVRGQAGAGAGTAAGRAVSSASASASASASGPGPDSGSGSGSASGDGEASVEPVMDRDALLADAMAAVPVADGAELSVAVLDEESGESAGYGEGAFDTASIVKVDILAALLLQAQDAGRSLTTAERTYATAMIEKSDNDAASALWRTIGRAAGLAAANERFGLTGTEGGSGALWGLTRTTAADQLVLLRQVFEEDSELDAASRSYLKGLMARIADGQDWGVSAAGSAAGLKNGWLARSTTGLWVINSIGRVTADGRALLVVTLSGGNATQADGISLVEAAAKAAVSVFATDTAGSTGSTGSTDVAGTEVRGGGVVSGRRPDEAQKVS
ncbi:serine hydrolase [Streptomyces ziwulingensis]|uniref:Serine hydrolase n=1 Tax=Streptomyces ziwulingensis TaxID=1045501 RepID=A0ABP9D8N8_9ACTN